MRRRGEFLEEKSEGEGIKGPFLKGKSRYSNDLRRDLEKKNVQKGPTGKRDDEPNSREISTPGGSVGK